MLKQPKTFREAEEMARLACSVETTMSSTPVSQMASQLANLSKLVHTMLASHTATSSTQMTPYLRK